MDGVNRAVVVAVAQQGGLAALAGGGGASKPVFVGKDEASASVFLDRKAKEYEREFNEWHQRKLERERAKVLASGDTPDDDEDHEDCKPNIQRVNSLTLITGNVTYHVVMTESDV